jgi:hypothetical protein
MSGQLENKLNTLLTTWPRGTVMVSKELNKQGYYRQLIQRYKKSNWIKDLGPKAYSKVGDTVNWTGGVYALQTQLNLPIHIGGRTALELLGYAHNASLGGNYAVFIFSHDKTILPRWFLKYTWQVNIMFKSLSLFNSAIVGVTSLELSEGYKIRLSCPEQAILELCALVNDNSSFEEALHFIESMRGIRPVRMQELLINCTSVKAKRIFLFLSEKTNMPWIEDIERSKIALGTGNRQIIKNGVFEKKYKITIPKEWRNNNINLEEMP